MSSYPAALYIVFTVIDSLALALTILRLFLRLHIRRFWWEDAWAAVAFVCGTAYLVFQYIAVQTASRHTAVISNRIISGVSTTTMFAVRMSILYSTIRISPWSHTRTFARVIAAIFFIFWVIVVVLKALLCANDSIPIPLSRNGVDRPNCRLPDLVIFFPVITDCISDAVLVALPLKLLWRVHLPPRQRRMILTLFSSSVFMSVFSLTHAISQLFPNYILGYILFFNLEMMSTLIVCNLLVVVTYVYRVCNSRAESVFTGGPDCSSTDDDFTTRNPPRRTEIEPLTVVELNVDTTYSGGTLSSLPPPTPGGKSVDIAEFGLHMY